MKKFMVVFFAVVFILLLSACGFSDNRTTQTPSGTTAIAKTANPGTSTSVATATQPMPSDAIETIFTACDSVSESKTVTVTASVSFDTNELARSVSVYDKETGELTVRRRTRNTSSADTLYSETETVSTFSSAQLSAFRLMRDDFDEGSLLLIENGVKGTVSRQQVLSTAFSLDENDISGAAEVSLNVSEGRLVSVSVAYKTVSGNDTALTVSFLY